MGLWLSICVYFLNILAGRPPWLPLFFVSMYVGMLFFFFFPHLSVIRADMFGEMIIDLF